MNNMLLERLLQEQTSQLKGGIYHRTQIDFCYNSNHIEGSQLTREQTRYIFETNTIGIAQQAVNVDDIVEAINHFRAFDIMLHSATEPLSQAMIKSFHSILKAGTSDSRKDWFAVEDYKKLPNEVGGKTTTLPEDVAAQMGYLLENYYQKKHYCFGIWWLFIGVLRKFILFRTAMEGWGAYCSLRNVCPMGLHLLSLLKNSSGTTTEDYKTGHK